MKTPRAVIILFICIIASFPLYFLNNKINNQNELTSYSIEKELEIHPLVPESKSIQIEIVNGDTLISSMHKIKIKNSEAIEIINILKKFYNTKNLRKNDVINIMISGYNSVDSFTLTPWPMKQSINISRNQEGYFIGKVINNIKNKRVIRAKDSIRSSLFETATEQGMFSSTIMTLVNLYKHKIDIEKKLRHGSSIDVLFERFFDKNNNPILDGKIIYASIKTDNNLISIYNYSTKNGYNSYFDADGNSIFSEGFKTPIQEGKYRISSYFGRRKHPIYGYYRTHRGVDYAANSGTIVRATANGFVDFAGTKGGYGKYIKIIHNKKYSTSYAHLLKFAEGIKKGSKIQKGQTIGYVGRTGVTTGSHLHYELIKHGKQIDPLSIGTELIQRNIPQSEFKRFKATVTKVNQVLQKTPYKTEVAMKTD